MSYEGLGAVEGNFTLAEAGLDELSGVVTKLRLAPFYSVSPTAITGASNVADTIQNFLDGAAMRFMDRWRAGDDAAGVALQNAIAKILPTARSALADVGLTTPTATAERFVREVIAPTAKEVGEGAKKAATIAPFILVPIAVILLMQYLPKPRRSE